MDLAEDLRGQGDGVTAKQPDAASWLERAEEARTLAAGLMLPEARLEMLKVAAAYERLAKYSEQIAGRNARAR